MEMTASALLMWQASAPATSAEASDIASKIQSGLQQLRAYHSLGDGPRQVMDDLFCVAEECKNPNWDGYGAAPVTPDTYLVAYRFLEALPWGTPECSIGAEPDGQVTVEWHRSPRRTLSVSISPEGELHYSALLGPRKCNGTELFLDVVPKVILSLISEVLTPAKPNGPPA